ncbi:MAG: tyrosine-protein phosphatase [Acidobacteriota bacterium]
MVLCLEKEGGTVIEGFHWILPARLAGSALPGQLRDLASDLLDLRRAGIRHLISLTEKPLAVARAIDPGIELYHFPIRSGAAPSLEDVSKVCEFTRRALDRGEPVLFHCRAGLGRTGTMLACSLVSLGWPAEDAIRYLRGISICYLESRDQAAVVRRYAAYRCEQRQADQESAGFFRQRTVRPMA